MTNIQNYPMAPIKELTPMAVGKLNHRSKS